MTTASVSDRLTLLASAMAGKPIEVRAADVGDRTWTDGTTVFVDTAAGAPEQVDAVAVQASLLAAGSLSPEVARSLVRRPELTRRYLAVEGHRALVANEDILPPRALRLADRATAAELGDAEASLAMARSRRAIGAPPPAFGALRPRLLLAAERRAAAGTWPGGAEETPPTTAEAGDLPDLGEREGDEDDGDFKLGTLLVSPVGGAGPLGRLLQHLFSPVRGRNDGGPAGGNAPTHVAGTRRSANRGLAASARAPDRLVEDIGNPTARTVTYPEWDSRAKRYRADWCTVIERDADDRGPADAMVADPIAVRRALARLGLGLANCRRQRQGDDLDIDAVVERCVDRLAGGLQEEDVYLGALRRRRDLAVLILLDVSGSAGEVGPTGTPVHESQRDAAAALVVALHQLGDRVGMFAFNSRGRRAVQVARLKRFDEPFDGAVVRRLHGLTPGAYTRLGAAIRHGTSLLERGGGTPRRLLVVLSDGLAYDHGYERSYGEADARRALIEARRQGIGCACLSVGGRNDAAGLDRVFGPSAHASVPSAGQLPAVIGPLFRAALGSAEAARRAYGRRERARSRSELGRRTR